MSESPVKRRHFIRQIIEEDLAKGKNDGLLVTRFPPEPNGYLHIGHAKSICLNFAMAKEYGGVCHLRFDDTNPAKEDQEYVDAIKTDITWLGFNWGEHLYYTSDYFQHLYDFAVELIKAGKAFVDSSTPEDIRAMRGSLTEPGVNSKDRSRTIADNLDLFQRMAQGEFAEGSYVLRAKMDMASPNINMRDPVLYRIVHAHHQRTGDKWHIYPMYDFAHSLSDALENITHSLCTLEFQDHRPLYDWCISNTSVKGQPQQTEFSRLNVSHTITSKRKLKQLVDENLVDGWDDPRMPTLSGLRRRGYPPAAIRQFCESVGISKSDSIIDMGLLEEAVRDELNNTAPRAMCVLNPLKIIIENYPASQQEDLQLAIHPDHEAIQHMQHMGERHVSFARELYIDRDDFMEDAPSKFFRLAPGREVRLRGAYVIKCESIVKDEQGRVTALRCSYDPDTLGKKPEGRKVKGVIHWVNAHKAKAVEVRLYDRLFTEEQPAICEDFTQVINPHSLHKVETALLESNDLQLTPGTTYQFERTGYFCVDTRFSTEHSPVFNRVVSLRDSWK